MKRVAVIVLVMILAQACAAWAVSSADILARVKSAEAGLRDFRADMVIDEANKKNVSGMGEGYGDFVRLEKGIVSFKRPDKIRFDGYAKGIKVAYIQNGYKKLVIAPMIRQSADVKNAPGKRQDSLDMGFLSSRLWKDNDVTVVSSGKDGVLKLKFHPKFGGDAKRHDMVWVDSKTLKITKREKYRGSGELRVKTVYSDFETLCGKLPIATTSELFDPQGRSLGAVSYRNIKVNAGLNDALWSMSQR